MSRIRADRIVNRTASGAPTFPNGAVVTGVATATTFSGNATGLTGTPNITVNNVVGAAATFSGAVSVGGTLTYQDVENVDSVGLITARSGINVTAGGLDLKGLLQEKVVITAGKLSDNTDITLDNGMVHYFTTTETTTATPNIRTTTGINTDMAIGDTTSVTIITTAAAAGYAARVNIDGLATGITTSWVGGSAPSTGGSSGLDMYSYQIIKTADATFTVIGNLTNAA
jgi:hypothetical protein